MPPARLHLHVEWGPLESICGMMAMDENWPKEIPSHWMVYFTVKNTDEAVKKAQSLGAKICVPPTDIPNVGRFSVIEDPSGGTFSVIAMACAQSPAG